METKVEEQIRRFVTDNFLFGEDDGSLKDDDSFLEKGIIDSTGVLELIAFVEKTFDVRFDDADLVPDNLDSIANVAGFVARKRGVAVGSVSHAG